MAPSPVRFALSSEREVVRGLGFDLERCGGALAAAAAPSQCLCVMLWLAFIGLGWFVVLGLDLEFARLCGSDAAGGSEAGGLGPSCFAGIECWP